MEKRPFLCALRRHKPRPQARWNDGYYFTSCARCGCSLVRTTYSRWTEPRGFRVVWQSQPPLSVAAAPRPFPVQMEGEGTELPIQAVFRHMERDQDLLELDHPIGMRPAAPPTPASASGQGSQQAPARRFRPSNIPDFMGDPRAVRAPAPPASQATLRTPERPTLVWERISAPPERTAPDPADPPEPPRRGPTLTTVALVMAGLALLLFALPSWGRKGEGLAQGAQQVAPLSSSQGQAAFVAAGPLPCRSAPAPDSEARAMLTRGARVRLLARDGEWVSLAYEEAQCWAQARYFSLEAPI